MRKFSTDVAHYLTTSTHGLAQLCSKLGLGAYARSVNQITAYGLRIYETHVNL